MFSPAYYKKIFIDFCKTLRKSALYAESRFLYDLNRKILMTDYENRTNDNGVIVSFTTHRQRISFVHYVLDSLFFQTIRPEEVRLYLSKGEYRDYPDVLKRFGSWLKIFEVEDLGSFKKFIPILQENLKDKIIISLDDDLLYPPNYIESLLCLKTKYPNALISFIGFKDKQGKFCGVSGSGICWNLEIFNPVATPYFFNKELFIDAIGIRNNDDMWISLSCQEMGVAIQAVHDNFFDAYRKYFIPLPSEKIHAVSAAPSDINIGKIAPKLEKHTRRVIQIAINKGNKINF